MRRRPYTVVLLDEIEKAHAEVFDVLLQVLDDGRLTDGQGRTVDFRNTVLIMTSNIRSAERAARPLPAGVPEPHRRDRRVQAALARADRARSSSSSSSGCASGSPSARIALELTDAAKEALAEAGWDPAYGARPLKRAIQRLVENPLALRLLEGDFADGDTIRVDAQDGELVFEKAAAGDAGRRLSEPIRAARAKVLASTRVGGGRIVRKLVRHCSSSSPRSCSPRPSSRGTERAWAGRRSSTAARRFRSRR